MLHFLRPGDCFGDFGANVGVYSVLAGSRGVGRGRAGAQNIRPIVCESANEFRAGGADQLRALRPAASIVFTNDRGGMNKVAARGIEHAKWKQ